MKNNCTFKYYLYFVKSKNTETFIKTFDINLIPDETLNYIKLYKLFKNDQDFHSKKEKILKDCFNEYYTFRLLGYNYK